MMIDSSSFQSIALVVGTRPEAIKMAPVVRALREHSTLNTVLISTGQQTDLLRSALETFDLRPDFELGVMTQSQSLAVSAARILERLSPVLDQVKPTAVLVQGDTTTAFHAGLAAYYARIPVGHIEAGLRTYDLENPFPEEANRQMLDRISRWCFAPTTTSRDNLLAERIDADKIHLIGNTGIDALLWALNQTEPKPTAEPFVLMTLHRRESFGDALRNVLGGLLDFLNDVPEARVVWPMHPNPAVRAMAEEVSAENRRIAIVPPLDYLCFAQSMASCKLILTDSGGIQEEAPSLGKRVLVARDTTERPEAIHTGQNRLIGRDRGNVHAELLRAWNEPMYQGPIPATNPYGDGQAARRLAEILTEHLTQ